MKLLSTICLELFRSSSSICFYKWLELLFIFITWTLRYRHLFWIEVFRIEVFWIEVFWIEVFLIEVFQIKVFRIKVFQIKVFQIKVFRIFFQCWNLKPVDHLFFYSGVDMCNCLGPWIMTLASSSGLDENYRRQFSIYVTTLLQDDNDQ